MQTLVVYYRLHLFVSSQLNGLTMPHLFQRGFGKD